MIKEASLIIVIELALAMLVALISVLIANRRKKNRLTAQLLQLADQVKQNAGQRTDIIEGNLIAQYQLDPNDAHHIAEELFQTEKQFISEVIALQMAGQLDGFYENLTKLLDGYLKNLPKSLQKRQAPPEKSEKPGKTEKAPIIHDLDKDVDPVIEEAPDWGDVFD